MLLSSRAKLGRLLMNGQKIDIGRYATHAFVEMGDVEAVCQQEICD